MRGFFLLRISSPGPDAVLIQNVLVYRGWTFQKCIGTCTCLWESDDVADRGSITENGYHAVKTWGGSPDEIANANAAIKSTTYLRQFRHEAERRTSGREAGG